MIYKIKEAWIFFNRLSTFTNGLVNALERIRALETYVKDLKYACDSLGYNPKIHGVRPLEDNEKEII